LARLVVLAFVASCGRFGFDPTAATSAAVCVSPTVASSATIAAGSLPRAVSLADLDGDGVLDIVVTNGGDDTFSVMLGRGDGTFAPQVVRAAGGSQAYSVATGDLDGDGNVDVAIGLYNSNQLAVFFGNGDGTLAGPALFPTGTNPQAVAIGDVDADGHLDVVVTAYGSNAISVLLGSGRTFAPHVEYAAGNGPYDVELADLNGDGRLDAVTSNSGDGTVSVLMGQAGGFAPHVESLVATGGRPWHMAIGDLNGDGRLDLAVADAFSVGSNTVGVLLGHGDGTFAQSVLYPADNPWWIAIADMDRDGIVDLVTANGTYASASVYPGRGDGTFGASQDDPTGGGANSLALGDLDGDGSTDLVVADDVSTNDLTILYSRCGPRAGSLFASFATQTTDIDLTATGTSDWSHWGLVDATSFDHKQGGGQITLSASNPLVHYTNDLVGFTWTDGSPTASSAGTHTGVYVQSVGGSVSVTAPADTSMRTLIVWSTSYLTTVTVTATLSDGSAPAYTDSTYGTLSTTNERFYTFTYRAGSPGQSLVVTMTIDAAGLNGNVSVPAATLTQP
jgi:hypothetical protein